MVISCEKCKRLFDLNERHLTSRGVTAVCPYCDHKHRVKRVVLPYSVEGEEDTEPYDVSEIVESEEPEAAVLPEEFSDSAPEEINAEPYAQKGQSKEDKAVPMPEDEAKAVQSQENLSYHLKERRKGVRGIILDRGVSVNLLYLFIAASVVVGFLAYLVIR